ncbi:MAG: acetyl-CoA hydrolase/transferase family protein [Planctomycetaceae bacterium]
MSGAPAAWRARAASADAVVARIESGMNVFVQGAAATPSTLLEALCRRGDLRDVRLWHLHPEGPVPFAADGCGGRFRSVSLFTGASLRAGVAGLVEDRACLQLGIGAIPDAVLRRLGDRRDLGIHTEMFSDDVVALVESGVITNRCKAIHPGRSVTSFVAGSRRLFDFVDDNALVELHPCDRTNDTLAIRKIERMTAINSALQVDLTGQVCADSIGHRIWSGIGGQMDFMRGAAMSRGGKPIIALPSTAAGGTVSRIVPEIAPGGGVVTTRGHVHWVVTEHGAVNLHGRTLAERGRLLLSIAHPEFRDGLAAALRDLNRHA